MALANGLLVHGPRHWAAAVRDDDGRVIVASGRSTCSAPAPSPTCRSRAAWCGWARRSPCCRRCGAGCRRRASRWRTAARSRIAIGATVGRRGRAAAPALGAGPGGRRRRRGAGAGACSRCAARARPSGTPSSTRASRPTRRAAPTRWPTPSDHAKEHDRCGSNLILPLLVSTTIGNTDRPASSSAGARSAARTVIAGAQHRRGRRGVLVLGAAARSTRSRGSSTAWATRCSRGSPPASRARATCSSAAPRWRPCCAPRRPAAATGSCAR